MNDQYLLPLNSPRWNELGSFGVSPNRIPFILQKLLEDPIKPVNSSLIELMNAIFHQYDIADAAYFVFPYFVDIHARYKKTNPYLFGLIANIAATAKVDEIDLPLDVRRAFLETLIYFEQIAISNLIKKGQPFADIFGSCMDALAFSRHCCGKLLMDVLGRDGAKHTSLICPQCQQQMEVELFEEGLVVIERGQDLRPPEPPRPYVLPLFLPHNERKPNPWHDAGSFLSQESQLEAISEVEHLHVEMSIRLCSQGVNPNVPVEEVFSLIGAILLTHGFSSSARSFFRLWDTVMCSKCEHVFVAAKGWWGCEARK